MLPHLFPRLPNHVPYYCHHLPFTMSAWRLWLYRSPYPPYQPPRAANSYRTVCTQCAEEKDGGKHRSTAVRATEPFQPDPALPMAAQQHPALLDGAGK